MDRTASMAMLDLETMSRLMATLNDDTFGATELDLCMGGQE